MMARPIMWLRTRPDHNRTNKQLLYLDEEFDRQQQQHLRNMQQQQLRNINNKNFFPNDFGTSAREKLLPSRYEYKSFSYF